MYHSSEVVTTLYGESVLRADTRGRNCCGLHQTVEEVVECDDQLLFGDVGDFPPIKAAYCGLPRECGADARTLKADQAFLEAARTMSIPGFAYLSEKGLSDVRCWETGTVFGLRAFGCGYCYLILFRERLRLRVARLLGPMPRVSDVLLLFRLGGLWKVRASFRSVFPGLFHCEQAGEYLTGSRVVVELLGLVDMDPKARIGVPEGYGYCERCCAGRQFVVRLAGHAERCRPVDRAGSGRVSDKRRALVGDAVHALDVKVALVANMPLGTQYTEVAKRYLSASAQRRYLESLGVEMPEGSSDHTWATEFEQHYGGQFRLDYLRWLQSELPSGFAVAGAVSMLVGGEPLVGDLGLFSWGVVVGLGLALVVHSWYLCVF